MFLQLDSLLCTENKSGKETAVDLKAYGIHGEIRDTRHRLLRQGF